MSCPEGVTAGGEQGTRRTPGLRGGNTDLNPQARLQVPAPGALMFLVTLGEITVSESQVPSLCACHPAQHAGSQVPDQGLNLCPCGGSMES